MMIEINKIYVGDALATLKQFPDGLANACVTSPPYYALRDYGIDGQIGLEETPGEFIARLVDVFREVKRVLRDDGTLWVNIGDSYAGSWKGGASHPESTEGHKQFTNKGLFGDSKTVKPKVEGCKTKDLIGIPWMLAFALREDGWFLRQDIIWHKPNAMPESVKDRCTKCHEYIFLLSKSRHYYFDYEAIREPAVGFNNIPPAGSLGALGVPQSRVRKGNAKTFRGGGVYVGGQSFSNSADVERQTHGNQENETGLRNKRDVWSVATRGFKDAHFATFPEQLIQPCILAGSPPGGIVIDPFMGSGTTAKVAIDNGRNYLGVEINPQYAEMANERTKQLSLFNNSSVMGCSGYISEEVKAE